MSKTTFGEQRNQVWQVGYVSLAKHTYSKAIRIQQCSLFFSTNHFACFVMKTRP